MKDLKSIYNVNMPASMRYELETILKLRQIHNPDFRLAELVRQMIDSGIKQVANDCSGRLDSDLAQEKQTPNKELHELIATFF